MSTTLGLSTVSAAFREDQIHPYEGADPQNATRLVALLWALCGLLTLAFLPLEPPGGGLRGGEWVIAALLGIGGIGGAAALLRGRYQPNFNGLLALSYAGLAQVAVLVWLGNGAGSAYQMLFLLWVASAMGVHPPRRALLFLGATISVAAVPLIYEGWTPSAVSDLATSALLWSAVGIAMLTLMVTVRSQRVSLRADEQRKRGLARIDPLTGLGNRRAFDESLIQEIARSRRAKSTVSVILLDLDHLKSINDAWGHIEGDRCLVQVAEVIKAAGRGGDRSFRWGGDEFVVLLPDTDQAGAEAAAAYLASKVQSSCADVSGRALSISTGPAQLSSDLDAQNLLARADMELMDRKLKKSASQALEPAVAPRTAQARGDQSAIA